MEGVQRPVLAAGLQHDDRRRVRPEQPEDAGSALLVVIEDDGGILSLGGALRTERHPMVTAGVVDPEAGSTTRQRELGPRPAVLVDEGIRVATSPAWSVAVAALAAGLPWETNYAPSTPPANPASAEANVERFSIGVAPR